MSALELRLCVPADASLLGTCRENVRGFLDAHRVDKATSEDILICVNEAAANAIEHSGSSADIEVELSLEDHTISILVSDHGRGLEPESFDPRRQPDPLRVRGRGLYVMAMLMDELGVSVDGGTEIRMSRRLAERAVG